MCVTLLVLAGTGCFDDSASVMRPRDIMPEEPPFTIEPLTWHGGRKAAVSITYDALWGQWRAQERLEKTVNDVLVRGLRMDFEFVTAKYDHPDYRFIVDDIRERMIPRGVHFYGHGHTHAYHDSLDYDAAYESFSTCFRLMTEWGLAPRAYSYPYGAGRNADIQRACRDAGFICARGVTTDPELYFICADGTDKPDNWFYLPTVPLASDEPGYVTGNAELVPILEEVVDRGAWVILMYHAIGFPGDWGYYPEYEFLRDIEDITSLDAWCGNMDDVACYIKERNAFSWNAGPVSSGEKEWVYELELSDGLDNTVYDRPLSLTITFDDSLSVRGIGFDPPIEGASFHQTAGNRVKVNVAPDETKRNMTIYFE